MRKLSFSSAKLSFKSSLIMARQVFKSGRFLYKKLQAAILKCLHSDKISSTSRPNS